MNDTTRCWWAGNDPIYIAYHDNVWSVPVYQDIKLFEMLSLEGAQAGLSWITILKRFDTYREAFEGFDPKTVAQFDENKISLLMKNNGIIRNELKIRSVVSNAKSFIHVQEQFGSFSTYIWQFVGGEPQINCFKTKTDVPAKTPISDAMSKDLKKRGFTFVGSTICYAYMQACGLVNDHIEECFLYPCKNK